MTAREIIEEVDFEHITDIVREAGEQAGMYYLEGGCMGYAAGLYVWLKSNGLTPRILLDTSFVHAWVVVNGVALDAQGDHESDHWFHGEPHTPETLRATASKYGTSPEQFDADADVALDLLRSI